MTGNRVAGQAYRNAVLLAMHEGGLASAASPVGVVYPNSNVAGDTSSVVGLPWTIITRAQARLDFSTGLRDLAARMQTSGQARGAIIFKHPRNPVGESYAVMPLSQLIAVIRDEQDALRSAS